MRHSEHGSDTAADKHANAKRKRRLKLFREKPQAIDRRRFVTQGVVLGLAGTGLCGVSSRMNVAKSGASEAKSAPIRPPSAALVDSDFQNACVRCGLCGIVCENGCIRFHGADENKHGAFTPYLDVRNRSCTLCMRCTQICPTGALTAIEDNFVAIAEEVKMGKAVVDPELCLSYQGRICGFCHDSCPIPETSIKLTVPALPVVLDGCVGCGRCVEQCPQTPTAIRIERRSA